MAFNEGAAHDLEIRPSTEADFDQLAVMNRELIEDEGHRNPMNISQLKDRFRTFVFQENWTVDLFLRRGFVAGYATYRHEFDNAELGGVRVRLRQFYIQRESRGSGIGREALELLVRTRFKTGARILLEVIETNPGGKIFWERNGFLPCATLMERGA